MKEFTFTHSLEFNEKSPAAIGEVFVRPPNHLNIMLTDAAKFVHFRDMAIYEDFDWSIRLSKLRFFTREYISDFERIHYIYNLGERTVERAVLERQRTKTIEQMAGPIVDVIFQQRNARANGMRWTAKGFVSK
jgi:hypothetical protein